MFELLKILSWRPAAARVGSVAKPTAQIGTPGRRSRRRTL